MREAFKNTLALIGFGLVVYGVYQISPAWSFIVLGFGVSGYAFLHALIDILKENKENK